MGQAAFAKTIVVANGNDSGQGSLRNALEQAQDGDVITFSNVKEVTLTSVYLTINKNVTIKGDGLTLRADFSPVIMATTNGTVRWEQVNFEIPASSFEQLALPTRAKVIFEACTGQWENTNTSLRNNATIEGVDGNAGQLLPDEGEIKPLVVIIPGDPIDGGGGGCTTTFYQDLDGDGFGNPAISQQACSAPSGYVSNNTDCNDNSSIEKPGQVWYKDSDNDGYGATGVSSITQCSRPTGYKAATELTSTTGDCNDSNPNINPGATEVCDGVDNNCNGQIDEGVQTTFYQDLDGDGFGNPAISQQACSAPSGYVSNNTDCNDSNPEINPNTVWYEDRDGDGYPSNRTFTGCNRPQFFYGGFFSTTFTLGKLASELAGLTLDCDDTNASISPGTVWYKDVDNDGFSDGASQQSCFRPSGYKLIGEVVPGGDCDDNDAAINPNTRWYPDFDNDGYSTGNFIVQCTRPEKHKLARELTAIVGDCNDNDAALNPNTLWFKDEDGDGYSDGVTLRQCLRPANYKLPSELINFATDCNDLNSVINPATKWFKDADNDGYSDGTSVTQCLQPDGYKLETDLIATNGDCNDNNADINPGATEVCDGVDNNCNGQIDEGVTTTFYHDDDGDGFGDPAVSIQACSAPGNYVTNNTDCDDTNPDINPNTVWYLDADSDGYYTGEGIKQCESPGEGYRYADLLGDGDCNDNDPEINPGAAEVCDGVDNNCNEQIDEGVTTTFYLDDDGDGFGDPAVSMQACSAPENYVTDNTDCDDTNPDINPNTVWYLDADSDGYYTGEGIKQCESPGEGYRYADLLGDGDCNDNNPEINPGAAEVCDGIDNNCNGQTDEGFADTDNDGIADCVDPNNDTISFVLVNSGTNGDIFNLTDGLQIDQNIIRGLSLNIRANTTPMIVGSVYITLAGPVNATMTDDVAPYALFGDKKGNYNGRNLPAGNYILTATPYSRSKRKGTVGSTTSIQFSIVEAPVFVTGITTTPSTFTMLEGSTLQISATVEPVNATNKTVIWSSSDPDVAIVNSNGLVTAISPGESTVTATTQDGSFYASTLVTVIQTNSDLSIDNFTLVNSGTNGDIVTLTDGMQIDQTLTQGLRLNLRANPAPSLVGSVYIKLSGPVKATTTDDDAPYSLFGEKKGSYNGRNLPPGEYILTATPYSKPKRRGTVGTTKTVNFSITSAAFRIDGNTSEKPDSTKSKGNASVMVKEPQLSDTSKVTRMYPNPVSDQIILELSEFKEEQLEVSIYDMKGIQLFTQLMESENGKIILDITNLRLKPGVFVLLVNSNGVPQTFKFLKK
ncbi:MAG: MopE-related protein [Algoriphagus sp.]